jgi:hypothetical protein
MTPLSERETERRAVLRERAAAARARCDGIWLGSPSAFAHVHVLWSGDSPCSACVGWAAQMYELPKIERPRVVTDGVHEYTWRNGLVQNRSASAFGWWEFTGTITDRNRSALLDLLANPTELIDDDGVQP